MTPTEFEILIKNLFEERLETLFRHKVPVDHLKKFTSASGNVYEIDLAYQFSLFGMHYLTLVECKYWDSHVTREKVGYLKSIMDELKAHKGIVVTTKGFQSGAIEYAKSNNIGLIKITNDNSFEEYSNFDGGVSQSQEILEREEVFDSAKDFTSAGLFYNKANILNFIGIHYGEELAEFLRTGFDPYILDDPSVKLDPTVKEQLNKISDEWYNNYMAYETCGLHYSLGNENELRIMNMTLYLLKVTKK